MIEDILAGSFDGAYNVILHMRQKLGERRRQNGLKPHKCIIETLEGIKNSTPVCLDCSGQRDYLTDNCIKQKHYNR